MGNRLRGRYTIPRYAQAVEPSHTCAAHRLQAITQSHSSHSHTSLRLSRSLLGARFLPVGLSEKVFFAAKNTHRSNTAHVWNGCGKITSVLAPGTSGGGEDIVMGNLWPVSSARAEGQSSLETFFRAPQLTRDLERKEGDKRRTAPLLFHLGHAVSLLCELEIKHSPPDYGCSSYDLYILVLRSVGLYRRCHVSPGAGSGKTAFSLNDHAASIKPPVACSRASARLSNPQQRLPTSSLVTSAMAASAMAKIGGGREWT
ncbi:hypothetical protein MIND_01374700 [Mycena indigotica]|uniref:Uncharacterized protein n=1 Tax=Mycena indigotica TaxID=2126181 RepID=A0A8H6RZJ7_9AGAR|nr:uncharacterized protein MIND_01374700 [Mycena indigotica]KAF7289137.1 hypothetical protein MIND_01374700 [Mycena indigotica]